MNLDLENVVEMCEAVNVIILLLKANLPVFIVLASEKQMVCWLNFEVVARAERVH